MALEPIGYVDLPPHAAGGGFDHAAVHGPRGLLYVSHTANDAVDVIDCVGPKHVRCWPPMSATRLRHLYVTIGDPGIIEVFDTETMRRVESEPTERGAHTIGFDAARNTVYAFLPSTHRAAVYKDDAGPRTPG
jgi:hypothetical protein